MEPKVLMGSGCCVESSHPSAGTPSGPPIPLKGVCARVCTCAGEIVAGGEVCLLKRDCVRSVGKK